jgi:hypothetical protein
MSSKISENRKLAALENITIPGFMQVASKLLGSISCEGIYHGNCDDADALSLGALLTKKLGGSFLKAKDKPNDVVTKVPVGVCGPMLAASKVRKGGGGVCDGGAAEQTRHCLATLPRPFHCIHLHHLTNT